jgi:hypothetical protein
MRKKGKPFVLYRRGPMSFSIVPRGLAGWAQLGIWIGLLVPQFLWFRDHVQVSAHEPGDPHAIVLFLLGLAIWFIAGLWWMIAHAEVVEWAEILRERQRARSGQRRHER